MGWVAMVSPSPSCRFYSRDGVTIFFMVLNFWRLVDEKSKIKVYACFYEGTY
jgi:hypothetical protein